MNHERLLRQLRNARLQRSLFALGLCVMIVSNLFLVGSYTQVQRTTVLVPSRVSDGMVAVGAVDARFVEALAMDAVYAFYNASPETSAYGRRVVERLSSFRERSSLLEAYDSVATDIRERRISTVFYPDKVDHELDGLTLYVSGHIATFIETKFVSREPRRLKLTFVEEAASVRLASISLEEEA